MASSKDNFRGLPRGTVINMSPTSTRRRVDTQEDKTKRVVAGLRAVLEEAAKDEVGRGQELLDYLAEKGITSADISALEKKFGVNLCDEANAVYRAAARKW